MGEMMPDLPDDILMEIFIRLPVKSVLRFRCVCKDWRCLISDSFFTTQYHNRRSTQRKPSLILTKGTKFYMVEGNSCQKLDILSLPSIGLGELGNDIDQFLEIKVVGSCNGLLCFSLAGYKEDIHYREPIYLLNPATRQVKELPHPLCEIPQSSHSNTRIGIGFDPVSNDYKVVMIVYYSYILFELSDVWVYSLNSDNWRKLRDVQIPNINSDSQTTRASNGAIHWMVTGKNRRIFSFDLVHEVFTELPLPLGVGYFRDIVAMGGYLSVFFDPFHEIWVMEEYGFKQSWTKQIIYFDSPRCSFTPVQFWNNQILLQRPRKKLALRNIKSKTVRNIRIHGLPNKFKAFIYTKSIVMLND